MLDRMPDALSLLSEPLIDAAARLGAPGGDAVLERPSDPEHGDYATTLALRLAKPLGRAPREIAEELASAARASTWVESADVAGPGFVNVRVSPAWYAEAVRRARERRATAVAPLQRHCASTSSTSRPTRPGRCPSPPGATRRTATHSRACSRLPGTTSFASTTSTTPARQIERFGLSLRARARGEPVPEDGYQGEALIALAQETGLAARRARRGIRAGRRRAHVRGDSPDADALSRADGRLHRTRSICTARAGSSGRSSGRAPPGTCSSRRARHGCARASSATTRIAPVIKSDGSPTYLAGDLAYLVHKLERGFDLAIYVLGADHHGYSAGSRPRRKRSATTPSRIEIAIYQMVHLTEDGEQKRMSKRRGDVVLLDELMDGIGVDAARFFLVQRSHDATIDIDLALAVEQSPENPVYYVQYAHARICSILRRAGDAAAAAPDDATAPEPSEAALVRALVDFPDTCRAAVELRAPHRVVAYARDLASAFSAFYRDCPVLDADTPARRSSRLAVCDATRQVLARALDLVGVGAPEEM